MADMILSDMESFDFSVPLNETVIIYDDCDEDDKSTISITHVEDLESEDSGMNFISENNDTPAKNESNESDDIVTWSQDKNNMNQLEMTEQINYVRKLENFCAKSNINPHFPVSDESTCNTFIHQTKLISNKRDCTEVEDKLIQKPNKKANLYTEDTESHVVSSHYFSNEVKHSASNYDKEAPCTFENNNKSTPTDKNSDRDIIIPTLNNTDVAEKKDEREELTDYIRGIFDTLSQNLAFCIQAYYDFLQVSKSANPVTLDSKRRFMSVKNHYFQLSYCAVVNIILPQENNNNLRFTEEFLNRTLKYAKEKMNLTYSKQIVHHFYYELVNWAKKKKEHIENKRNSLMAYDNKQLEQQCKQNNDTPTLAMQLAQPPILPNAPNLNRIISRPSSKITNEMEPSNKTNPNFVNNGLSQSFQSASTKYSNLPQLPVTQQYSNMAIPTLPEYQKMPHYPSLVQGRVLPEYQNVFKPPELPTYTNYCKPICTEYPNLQSVDQDIHQTQIFTGGVPNREVVISVSTDTLRDSGHVNATLQSQQNPASFLMTENNFHEQFYDGNHPTNRLNLNNLGSNQHVMDITRTQTPNRSAKAVVNTGVHYPYHYNNCNTLEKNNNSSIDPKNPYLNYYCNQSVYAKQSKQPPAYSYYSQNAQHQQHPGDYVTNHIQAEMSIDPQRQNEPITQPIESSRSSISTDSGYASPLQFNTVSDGQTSPPEDGQTAPLITHVTSLNPNVVHIAEGFCYVCNGRTKKKCLGCLQIYYCSTGCQAMDWSRHKGLCKAVNQSRQVKNT